MLGKIIDKITGPSPEEHLAIENAESEDSKNPKPAGGRRPTEYDGETVEELLPPRSKGGVHMSYSPSREHLRQIAEQHGPEQMFGMQYQIGQCGTWQFVERIDEDTVREQCDNCGEYRTIEQDNT